MEPLDPMAAFREAVLDFAGEPTPVNARRYLAASLLLERASAAPPTRRRRTRRTDNAAATAASRHAA